MGSCCIGTDCPYKTECGHSVCLPDYVTGGHTRAGFLHAVETMQSSGSDLLRYAVLYVDVKNFKAVNESFGEHGGNSLLKFIYGRIMRSELHPVVGSRSESDHFLFLIGKSDLDMAVLAELLHFHWKYGGRNIYIHCVCGICYIDSGNVQELLFPQDQAG